MAQKATNDHTQRAAHAQHEGSSIGFYVFIALVLGAITYVEFALVEHREAWFGGLSGPLILTLLIVLSVVKFVMVIMFFMHLKQDDRTFTGLFSSGMVIAVGTLFALSALFTVRSVAAAQTPIAESNELQAEANVPETETEFGPSHRYEYPAPKTLDVSVIDITPMGGLTAGGSVADGGATGQAVAETPEVQRTTGGIPLAPPPAAVTLADPFSPSELARAELAQTEGAAPADATPGDAPAAGPLLVDADVNAGEQIFVTNCASCHQATGQGVPGAFPPLVGHAAELAVAEGGHEYLENLLLYGLQGEIEVGGQPYNGQMPAWAQLSDDDLANVLNYIVSAWGNADALPEGYPAFTAEGVASGRETALSAAQVYELRQTLGLP